MLTLCKMIFDNSVGRPSTPVTISFVIQRFFVSQGLVCQWSAHFWLQELYQKPTLERKLAKSSRLFPYSSFGISSLTLRSLLHLKFIYLGCVCPSRVREEDLVGLFYMEVPSFRGTIFWRGCFFLQCSFCQKSEGHNCVGFSLGPLFHWSTILSSFLYFFVLFCWFLWDKVFLCSLWLSQAADIASPPTPEALV